MNHIEQITSEIAGRWPMKFSDDELLDFANRLNKYSVSDIVRALDEHKNTQKFKPAVSEILARLKGKETEEHQNPAAALTFGQILANKWNDGRSAIEAVLRHWRTQYSMEGGRALQFTGHEQETRIEAAREYCTNRCRGGLIAEGVCFDAADRWSRCITTPADNFGACLSDLRNNGIEMAPAPEAKKSTAVFQESRARGMATA